MHPDTINAWIYEASIHSNLVRPLKRVRVESAANPQIQVSQASKRYNLRNRIRHRTEPITTSASAAQFAPTPHATHKPPYFMPRKKYAEPQSDQQMSRPQSTPHATEGYSSQQAQHIQSTSPKAKAYSTRASTSKQPLAPILDSPDPNLFLPALPHTIAVPSSSYAESLARQQQADDSGKRKSRSPSKKSSKFADMELNYDPLTIESLDKMNHNEKARQLLRSVRRIAESEGVLKDKPSMADDGDDVDNSFFQQDRVYSRDSWMDKTPPMSIVRELCAESNKCDAEGAPEPTWNALVHTRLMQVARDHTEDVIKRHVSYKPITTASLLEQYRPMITAETRENRKIDFTLAINVPSIHSSPTFRQRPVNPSIEPTLRRALMGVLIETKTYADARKQLAVWSFGVFRYLRDTIGQAPEFLPLLVVDRNRWELMFALEENIQRTAMPGSDVYRPRGIVLYGEQIIGYSTEASGVCKILAALGCLYKWLHEDYAAWFVAALASHDTSVGA